MLAKKPQMMQLAKQSDYHDDPTLLHPFFAKLPPLFPDTPGDAKPPASSPDPDNPYSPLILSEIFQLTDALQVKYPWNGRVIRGREIIGDASVIVTYEQEDWDLDHALHHLTGEIIRPGFHDDEHRPLPGRRLRVGRRVVIALGVLLLGVGLARYASRLGPRATWQGVGLSMLGTTQSRIVEFFTTARQLLRP